MAQRHAESIRADKTIEKVRSTCMHSKSKFQSLLNTHTGTARFVGYGIGDFGLNLYWQSLSQLLLFYYATILDVNPIIAGQIFFAGTLWDAFTDPIMAVIAERTRSRFGRYRPYILGGGLALSLSFIVLMAPIYSTSELYLVFLFLTHLLFRTSYTMVSVPYSALSSTMTSDSRQRTILSGYRMFFAFCGGFAISATAFPIIRATGNGTNISKQGFFWFACICAVISIICFLICYASTKEQIEVDEEPTTLRHTLSQAAANLRLNRSLHTLVLFIACQSAAGLIFASLVTFYVQSATQPLQPMEMILGANAIIGIATLPLWTFIAHRFGKRKTWVICSIFIIVTGLHLSINGATIINGFVAQFIIMSAFQSAFGILVWSMIPDTIEYGAWKTGLRSEAATFGIALFMQKTSIGLTGLILGYILANIGYQADDSSLPIAVNNNISTVVGLGPALLLSLALIPLWLHPVTRESHEAARKAIATATIKPTH